MLHPKLSAISAMHYFKLFFRAALFLAALLAILLDKAPHTGTLSDWVDRYPLLLWGVWLVFAVEMLLRFFPSRLESMGCQKQFAKNLRPTAETVPERMPGRRTFGVVLFWVLLNGAIGALYLCGVIGGGAMLLLALAYSVCDMICILFFCPFQTWIMKNKCCTTCRIYNWDYAMMFTPLFFLQGFYAAGLSGLSLLLLLRWEITYRRHPERFAENTNESLACRNCREKLCHHKTQLQQYLRTRTAQLHCEEP